MKINWQKYLFGWLEWQCWPFIAAVLMILLVLGLMALPVGPGICGHRMGC